MVSIDPRAKILWAIGCILIIFSYNILFAQILISAAIFLCIKISDISFKLIYENIKYIIFFLPITLIIHFLFTTGYLVNIFKHGNFIPSINSFIIPLTFTLRLANFMFLMSWIIKWVNSNGILDSIYLLLRPLRKLKLPVDDLFQIIFIAIRFFPILQEEYKRLDMNWKNYSNTGTLSIKKKVINLQDILIPLMIFSFRRSETLATAMMIRGYGKQKRTYYTHLKLQSKDIMFILFSLCFFLLIIITL